MTPAHHVTPAPLKVSFDKGRRDVLDFSPFFVLVRGWLVPVYDTLDQIVRLAKPTLRQTVRNDDGRAKSRTAHLFFVLDDST